MKTIQINPKYTHNDMLCSFINNLPDSFVDGGEILWNGRNAIKAFDIDNTDNRIVVKRFKHPNFIQQIGYTFRKHKARKAFENGMELISRGIDTPTPIAFAEYRNNGFIKDAFYICDELVGYTEIRQDIERSDWNRDVIKALAHFFAQMHKAGILHHDLNNTNILYSLTNGEYHFIVIDINRVTFYDSIQSISMRERIENMTRFTSNYDLFLLFAQEYAKACQIPDSEAWVRSAIEQKKRHDRNWDRKKFLLHPNRWFKKR